MANLEIDPEDGRLSSTSLFAPSGNESGARSTAIHSLPFHLRAIGRYLFWLRDLLGFWALLGPEEDLPVWNGLIVPPSQSSNVKPTIRCLEF